jgi:hypothetical protein
MKLSKILSEIKISNPNKKAVYALSDNEGIYVEMNIIHMITVYKDLLTLDDLDDQVIKFIGNKEKIEEIKFILDNYVYVVVYKDKTFEPFIQKLDL